MEWRLVPQFEAYECSEFGDIRKADTKKPIALSALNSGYLNCTLRQNGVRWSTTAHRVVAVTFIGLPPTKQHEINHKNGRKKDNRACNLEWVTRAENQRHKITVLNNGEIYLSEAEVREIVQIRNDSGLSHAAIAKMFGVSTATIGHIFSGHTWGFLWPNGKPDSPLTGVARNQYTAQFKSKDDIRAAKIQRLEKELSALR